MAKKKKKQLNLEPVSVQAGGRYDNDMLNDIHHGSDIHFTMYVISNGYLLSAFLRKRNPSGDITGSMHEMTYVPTLDEVPKTIAALRAAFIVK